jgi:hypothetical protein
VDETAIIYARLCELASRLDKPESLSELRRLGAIHRWEYERLPQWIKDEAGLKESGIEPGNKGQ